MSEFAWYVFGLLPLLVLAGGHAAIDRWLHNQPRPLPRRAEVVIAARWGFLAAVLVYAWLIDSRRIPYAEPGIWLLFGAGLGLTVITALVVLRGKG